MESETILPKANTTFALTLLKKLCEDDRIGNIFCSPFSISSALAMVMLGTRGNTATQMSEVLCFTESERSKPGDNQDAQMWTQMQSPMQSQMQMRKQMRVQIQQSSRLPQYLLKCLKPKNGKDDDDVHASFAQLLNELNKPDVLYVLRVANRLYGEQSYTFEEQYLAETCKHYNAALEAVDFSTNAESARVNINNWVNEKTEGKIKDLLSQETVDNSTKLVLVNAIYFKGKWSTQFEEEFTVDATFQLNKTTTKPVKMMQQKSKFRFSFIDEVKCKILEMPYKGNELSMIIILPNDIEDSTTGLEQLEQELTYEKFKEWTSLDMTGQVEVEVRLPRFKMEETYDLNDVLTHMGMVDAFDGSKSDFSGMSSGNDLVLSKVVHKAFVEVNEEGTEAAAATAAVVSERSLMIPETFIADHPFLFFIRHNASKSVLFAGRFCSPE